MSSNSPFTPPANGETLSGSAHSGIQSESCVIVHVTATDKAGLPGAEAFRLLAAEAQVVEEEYASAIQNGLRDVMDLLKLLAASEAQGDCAPHQDLVLAQDRLDRIINSAQIERELKLQTILEELESVAKLQDATLLEREILEIESQIAAKQAVVDQMLRNPAGNLGKAIRTNIESNELRAYLRGLRFQTSNSGC